MNDRVLFALSLCRKAGALAAGFEKSCDAAAAGAPLVLLTADASPRTKRAATERCSGTKVLELRETSRQLAQVTGKVFAVAAVTDQNLATLVAGAIGKQEEESYAD